MEDGIQNQMSDITELFMNKLNCVPAGDKISRIVSLSL